MMSERHCLVINYAMGVRDYGVCKNTCAIWNGIVGWWIILFFDISIIEKLQNAEIEVKGCKTWKY